MKRSINTILEQKQTRKDIYAMDAYLTSYIDNNIIKAYCDYTPQGYSLDVSELTTHDRSTLANILYEHDEVAREMIDDYMQQIINKRTPFLSAQSNKDYGLNCMEDRQTGESYWVYK